MSYIQSLKRTLYKNVFYNCEMDSIIIECNAWKKVAESSKVSKHLFYILHKLGALSNIFWIEQLYLFALCNSPKYLQEKIFSSVIAILG